MSALAIFAVVLRVVVVVAALCLAVSAVLLVIVAYASARRAIDLEDAGWEP